MKSLFFQIRYEGWSAELQFPAAATLEDLAFAIIDAVGFQMDHCFGFYSNLEYPYHSDEEYCVFADMGESDNPNAIGVESTPIHQAFSPGKTMIFLFDYGENWQFPITCTGEIDDPAFKKPKILSTTGQPPTQYEEWIEDDES